MNRVGEFGTIDPEIRRIVRSCGQYAKRLAAEHFEVSEKGPDDFVTTVDQALDRELAKQFSALCPNDGVITEENEASRQYFQTDLPLWCIDPLDGTKDFIGGDPNYAVLVGRLEKPDAASPAKAIAGWIYAPEHDVMYHGGPGLGLWRSQGEAAPEQLNPQPRPLSDRPRVMLGDTDLKKVGPRLQAAIPEIDFVQCPGSFGLKVMNAILGQADVYVYFNGRVKVWDTAASLALAEAAGVVCCDLNGQPLGYAPDQINLESLAHQQSIVIGWASYVESLLPRLRSAMLSPAAS